MTTEWLVEAPGEGNEPVADFLAAHGFSPYETEMIDVHCSDGKKRDMYSVRGDFVRKIIEGQKPFPQFKLRFWSRRGHDFDAYSADWLTRKDAQKNASRVLKLFLETLERNKSKKVSDVLYNLGRQHVV